LSAEQLRVDVGIDIVAGQDQSDFAQSARLVLACSGAWVGSAGDHTLPAQRL